MSNYKIKLRGSISIHARCYVLTISSKKISKELGNKIKSVKVVREGKSWNIYPYGNTKLWNYSNGQIRIPVSNFLSGSEKKEIIHKYKYVTVNLNKEFGLKKFIQKDRAFLNPLYAKKDIPKDILWVSAYISKRCEKGYKLVASRKGLYTISKRKDIRVLFQNIKNGVIIRLSKDKNRGRKLYASKRKNSVDYRVEIAIVPKFIIGFNKKIGIPLKEFGLSPDSFSENIYEKKLIKSLEKTGIDVYPGSTQTIGDIFFKNQNGFIEVTSYKPFKKDTTSRHSSISMQIRGRLFEAEHYSINRGIKPIFLILRNEWKNNKHLLKEIVEVKKHNIFVIFTDYKKNWADDVAKRIKDAIK